MKGRQDVGDRAEQWASARQAIAQPRPQGEPGGRHTKRLGQFDRDKQIDPSDVQAGRKVIRQCRVVVEERITQAIGGVRHPSDRKDALAEVLGELIITLQQKGAVAAGSGVQNAGTVPQTGGSNQRHAQDESKFNGKAARFGGGSHSG